MLALAYILVLEGTYGDIGRFLCQSKIIFLGRGDIEERRAK